MLLVASYEMIPLDSGLSVGQGAVGVGVSIGHRQYSQHSLKVTHLLSLVLRLTQQCSPSGLKCEGPRCRTTAPATLLMNSSSSTASLLRTMGTSLPSGNCHIAPGSVQYQADGLVATPDPTSENEMISPVWSVPSGSLGDASRAVCKL